MPDLTTSDTALYDAVCYAVYRAYRAGEIKDFGYRLNFYERERLRRSIHTYTPDELEILIVIHWTTGVDPHETDDRFTFEMTRLVAAYEHLTGAGAGTIGSAARFREKHFGV